MSDTWIIPGGSVIQENADGADWLIPGSSIINEPVTVVGAIMNQFQKTNIGADLYNGAIIA